MARARLPPLTASSEPHSLTEQTSTTLRDLLCLAFFQLHFLPEGHKKPISHLCPPSTTATRTDF